MALTAKQVGIKYAFRSGLEEKVAEQLVKAGVPVEYEKLKVKYVSPPEPHVYTPDFELPNGIIIETKGRFLPGDRKKHLQVKAQNPHLDIRFVFTRSKATISKTSTTSYADWCTKAGFKYADKLIPAAWLEETLDGHAQA